MALIDDVRIKVKAGNGGNGSIALLNLTSTMKAYSDGGNGGDGGSIYFQASSNISDLNQFRFTKVVKAKPGEDGSRKNMKGHKANDEIILVPPGTKIIDEISGDEIEITELGIPVLLAQGGRGGRGSHGYKPNTHMRTEYTPDGGRGEEKDLHLILSLIADAGLIGFPNAGKSSLLATLTAATPKIGNYPFTTLEPSLGTLGKIVLADIPGLIEGASEGRGLGITFLKHIEKTKVLLHCISSEDPNPNKTYEAVHKEFQEFNVELNEKHEIILLTKTDLITEPEIKQKVRELKKLGKEVFPVSIYNEESIEKLGKIIKTNTQ